MKYLLNIGILFVISLTGFSQPVMQASIGAGSSATRVIVYIKPTLATSGTISTLQFDVAVPAAVTPAPTVGIVGIPAFGITWNIDPSYIEGGVSAFPIYNRYITICYNRCWCRNVCYGIRTFRRSSSCR
jgi:hypothetical protein